MGAAEIEAFLSHIGVQRHCLISTQGIALNALIYLYKRYMGLAIGDLDYSLASVPKRLPVAYNHDEVAISFTPLLRVTLCFPTQPME